MSRLFSDPQREVLFLAADGRCVRCSTRLEPGWHADHVLPWSRGGETEVTNGQALCPTCNRRKGNRGATETLDGTETIPLTEVRKQFGRLVDRAHLGGEAFVITKHEGPRAVIVSYESYQHLRRGAEGQDHGAAVGQTPVGTCPDQSGSEPAETLADQGQCPAVSGPVPD